MLQDIIDDDEIKLDWFFKASMMNDLVNVRDCNLFLPVKISHGFTINNKQCVILLDRRTNTQTLKCIILYRTRV